MRIKPFLELELTPLMVQTFLKVVLYLKPKPPTKQFSCTKRFASSRIFLVLVLDNIKLPGPGAYNIGKVFDYLDKGVKV